MTDYPREFHPDKVLQHQDFKLIPSGTELKRDPSINLGCAYGPKQALNNIIRPSPSPGPGQVRVHVRATGICGSDCHFWHAGAIGDMIVNDTCNAGHESAGEVIEVGEGVTEWKKGDRVAIEAGLPCGQCEFCLTGRYNACPDVVFFSTPPYHGLLTRYHIHPANWLHRLPDNVSFAEGALLEPLAVALAGLERSELKLGDPLVICGAGPIGLVTLLAAHAAGAAPIVITDLSAGRLEVAKKLVPGTLTLQIERGWSDKDTGAKIRELAGIPGGLNQAIDCSGVESSIRSAAYAVKFGATVFIIGVGKDEITLPFGYISSHEIDIKFQYRYANQYPKAIRLVQAGLINLKPLVTHTYTLETAVEAFHTASDPSKGAIKVQIHDEAL